MRNKILLLALTIAYLSLNPTKIEAKEIDFSVFPSLISVDSVEEESKTLNVTNNSDSELTLIVSFEPVIMRNGTTTFVSNQVESRISSYIESNVSILDEGKKVTLFTLAPKQKKTLNVSINTNAYHLNNDSAIAILLTSTKPEIQDNIQKEELKATSAIRAGIASIVLLNLGKGEAQLDIAEFTSQEITRRTPQLLTLTLTNTASKTIRGYVNISTSTLFGLIKSKEVLSKFVLLPQSTRTLSNNTMGGDFEDKITIDGLWLPGLYTTTVDIKANGGVSKAQDLTFVFFPIRNMLILVGVSLLFIIIVKRAIQKVRQKA